MKEMSPKAIKVAAAVGRGKKDPAKAEDGWVEVVKVYLAVSKGLGLARPKAETVDT